MQSQVVAFLIKCPDQKGLVAGFTIYSQSCEISFATSNNCF